MNEYFGKILIFLSIGTNEVISCLVIVLGNTWKFLGARAAQHRRQGTTTLPKKPGAVLTAVLNVTIPNSTIFIYPINQHIITIKPNHVY